MGDNGTNLLLDHAFKAIDAKDYVTLYNHLRTICVASGDDETLKQLEQIEKEIPISMTKLQKFYYKADSKKPRKKIKFRDLKEPLRYEEIPTMFERYMIRPLLLIAYQKLGSLSESKSHKINKVISARAEEFKSKISSIQPKVVFDT